jgi:hypothetical protein
MMEKVHEAPNLIKIASEASIENNTRPRFNYRTKIYSVVLIALLITLTSLIISRSMFDATILRVPGQILQENKDGTISNLYRVKIVSKSMQTQPYHIQINHKDARIEYVGKRLDSLHSGASSEETFFIKIPANRITKRKEKYTLEIMSGSEVVQTKEVTFIGAY